MSINIDNLGNGVFKASFKPFLLNGELDLKNVKGHTDYLKSLVESLELTASLMSINFNVFEEEFKTYFKSKLDSEYPLYIAFDMDSIIHTLDSLDFAQIRLLKAIEYIKKRYMKIIAMAIIITKETKNLSSKNVFEYLEVYDENDKSEILQFVQEFQSKF